MDVISGAIDTRVGKLDLGAVDGLVPVLTCLLKVAL